MGVAQHKIIDLLSLGLGPPWLEAGDQAVPPSMMCKSCAIDHLPFISGTVIG
jgi:hypothetical protein